MSTDTANIPPAILFFQVLEQARPVLKGKLPPGHVHTVEVSLVARNGVLQAGSASISAVSLAGLDAVRHQVEIIRGWRLIPALVQIGETNFLCSVHPQEPFYSIHVRGPLLLPAGKDAS